MAWPSGTVDIAGRYVEIFDHLSPEEFGRRNRERHQRQESGGQKQTTTGQLDIHLIEAAARETGISDPAVCHPSLMYRLFNRFWFGNRALDLVLSRTRYVPMRVTAAAVGYRSARAVHRREVLHRGGTAEFAGVPSGIAEPGAGRGEASAGRHAGHRDGDRRTRGLSVSRHAERDQSRAIAWSRVRILVSRPG